jgi:hypothetical protein
MRTVDGIKGTAKNIHQSMSSQEIVEVYSRVLMKYKIMKIRVKISYSALQCNITVKELIIFQITKTYQEFFRGNRFPMTLMEIFL